MAGFQVITEALPGVALVDCAARLIQYSRGVSVSKSKVSREQRIFSLARQIAEIMRNHPDRLEALDANSVAKILFRENSTDQSDRSSLTLRA
jgi:hypothetical protein